MDAFKEYRIYNACGELVDTTNEGLAAKLYQLIFCKGGKVETCYVTPLVIVARTRLVETTK